MTDDEIKILKAETEEYASLITQFNYEKPKFNLLVRNILSPGVRNNSLAESFNMAFDVDNAVGAQLDVIGRLIGLGRLLDYVPSSGSREMDDDEYRLALKLTIAKNTWDGTLGSLKQIYRDALGENVTLVYNDNQDMTVGIEVYGSMTTRETEMLERSGLLLVPAGVGKTVYTIGENADTTLYSGLGIYSVEWVECVNAN